jgi:ankyrin repeat protein
MKSMSQSRVRFLSFVIFRVSVGVAPLFLAIGCGSELPEQVEVPTTGAHQSTPKQEGEGTEPEVPASDIWTAVSLGKLKTVAAILEAGGDVNGPFLAPGVPGSGGTPLHIAAIAEQVEIANLLIFKGADVNAKAKDTHGGTPLHWAAFFGKPKMAKLLIEASAEINAKDNHGFTPLDATLGQTSEGKVKVAELLRAKGATSSMKEVEKLPAGNLWQATAIGDLKAIKQLIDSGIDLNKHDPNHGSTPLTIAAFTGQTDAAGLLIDNGAKIDVKNTEGLTPLFIASFFCQVETLELLIEKGADLSIVNKDGLTAFDSVGGEWDEELANIYTQIGQLHRKKLDLEHLKKTRPIVAGILKKALEFDLRAKSPRGKGNE